MTEAAVFAAFPTLKTPRLVLRQIRPEDADAVYRLFADDEVTRYYDLDTFTDPAQARDLIERFQRRFDSQIGLRWGLALANAPADLIGTCGYNIWIRPARRGLLGYDLAPEHWGRGLMREALAAILAFGFSTMQLNRVEALTFPPKDVDALAESISRVLKDHDLKKRLAVNGLKRAEEFRWERVARRVMDYYTVCIERAAKRPDRANKIPLF